MVVNLDKVKGAFSKLQEIEKEFGYREFEVAYLILERLSNIVDTEADITKEIVDEVNNVADSVDTLLDEYVNEQLDEIERNVEEDE